MTLFERILALEFGWRDALDIFIVAFILYTILVLIRGTRAMQMAVGLMVIGAAFFLARAFELLALEAISREILFYLPFAIIILFQHEIRKALASFGKTPLLSFLGARAPDTRLDHIVDATSELARKRIGALIVLERTQSLRMYGESGKQLDAILTADLLLNIFIPSTPLHDGAVIVHANRIVAAGCFLPLSADTEISKQYGTRHRAALGLSEETDALIVVISEENGSIAVALDGALHEHLDVASLRQLLLSNGTPPSRGRE